ncbi:MAG: hypothetical protein JST46_11635 [Bacteroidetes bacterium]|nr:hypothetical protein [Bacteroidota bacterium]
MDKLFREKLQEHSLPPGPQTWDRVTSAMTRKKSTVWYRWAAVLVIGASVATTIWWTRNPNEIAETSSAPDKQPLATTQVPQTSKASPSLKEEKKTVTKTIEKKMPQPASPSEAEALDEVIVTTLPEEEIAIAESEPSADPVSSSTEKSMVLVYTLEPIETAEHSAPEEVRKESSLNKVMDFARNVKNGESVLGDLKEAKLEFFALDHRKKSNSKNNE